MIINCEKCGSRFNLDERLLKENGSRVRCSVCKNIFLAFPPLPEKESDSDSELEETVNLDSPPSFSEDNKPDTDDNRQGDDFEKAFENVYNVTIEQNDTGEEEKTETEVEPSGVTRKNRRPGLVLMIIIAALVVISGAFYVYLFAPSFLPEGTSELITPPKQEDLTDTGNRRLEIADLEGKFFSTDNLGQLYIIKGKIINAYPKSRSYLLVKGTLEDENKNTIDRKLVYAGNVIREHELKDITINEIEKRLKNKSGDNNSNLNVPPQESVPFMIIFYNLPDSLSEYVVETVSSSPGE